eukprot:TRINITY_DN7355_c0_g1_i1.p1 TRINITY_DN7355_c0_g1~~TRINITY_DN7355_c0_g1_i1.p1  ORF type:complete len:239 (+),score=37.73 TRINITY_DN7355_c0_g1_i1:38-754(+)
MPRERRQAFVETNESDMCLQTDDGTLFYCNHNDLIKNSPYFQAMLKSTWKESSDFEKGVPIRVNSISSDIFRSLLHFLLYHEFYMPSVETDFFSTYFEIVYNAGYFGIIDLEDYLGPAAKDYLCPSTVSMRWKEASIYGCSGLQRACEKFLCQKFIKVSEDSNWRNCPRELLKNVLRTGDIDVPSSEILKALEMWSRLNLYKTGCMPSLEDVHRYIDDLLPPSTLFSQENKRFLLTFV